MNRLSVIQSLINHINAKTYLELGVDTGDVFLNVSVPIKYGVDPLFKFGLNFKSNSKNEIFDSTLYQMKSDLFFDEHADLDLIHGIDIAFVDGLHTYEQSLKDIHNCLKFLNSNGFIVVHDCSPLSSATGYPVVNSIDEVIESAKLGNVPGWNGCWNGDVWKSIVHLRSEWDDLNIFTLDLDWGLGIISRGKRDQVLQISTSDIKAMSYSDLDANRVEFLNLKPPRFLFDFLENSKSIN